MAEADNVGYKRSKKGTEKPMPNDLYDIEYAPTHLDIEHVISKYDMEIEKLESKKKELIALKNQLEEKYKEKETANLQKRIDKLSESIEDIEANLDKLDTEKCEVGSILSIFYENNILKEEYMERDDEELINYFKNGILSRYRSEDILLRSNTVQKILDAMRQEVVWS